MHRLIFAFFLASGFTSLVFEVVWERSLARVFGTSSLALSTLLTSFMAGLALGSWLGGKLAARTSRPLRLYGLLEGGIGVFALLVPTVFGLLPSVYQALFDSYLDDLLTFSLLRFAVVFTILLVPTTLMGATLPLVSQWVAQRETKFQGLIGALYGLNTLGACLGALLAGFLLLPNLGLQQTNTLFAAANIILCVFVLLFDAHIERSESDVDSEDNEELDFLNVNVVTLTPLHRMILLVTFACTGLVSMSYQVLWTRGYVIVLGSSTYSFTVILTTFLAALALGTAVFSSIVHRVARPVYWFAAAQAGFAAAALLAFFVLDKLPEWLFYRLREEISVPAEIYLYQFMLVGTVVFLPVFIQGATFPLVIRSLVMGRADAGHDVGRIYAFNTGGAILGSFAAGFILLPTLGLRGALTLVVAVHIVVALVLIFVARSRDSTRSLPLFALVSVAALGLLLAPGIDQAKLTRGMFRTYWARELFDPAKLAKDHPEIVYYADGLSATISVEKRGRLVTLKSNGKPEASDGADMATQILVALLPFLVRAESEGVTPGNEMAAMVGYGSGVTAGAALQWPLKRLDVIEIEGKMVGASRFFDHVNHKPLEDPRTFLYESDGRNFLEYTQNQYDVIVSEPSNPWIAGVAALFTVEHFNQVATKLAPKGVFGQWVQLYEIRPENVKVIVSSFLTAFPDAVAFSSMPKGTDLILIGGRGPIRLPAAGFQAGWADPVTRAELKRAGITSPQALYGLMFMNNSELRAFGEGAPHNTDDNGLLEFEAPKDLIRYDVGEKYFQERYFRSATYGDPREHLEGWPDDWTQDEVADLAKAEWVAGKAPLADALILDGWKTLPDKLGPPPWSKGAELLAVREVQELNLDRVLPRFWPNQDSELHRLVSDSAAHDTHMQALIHLEQDGEPAQGFDGEKGLAYAYILTRRRYYKHAFRQLRYLERKQDPIVESAAFNLLIGHVHWKRRRYPTSFEGYLKFALFLAQAQ